MNTKTKVLIGLGIVALSYVAYKMLSPKKDVKSNADGEPDYSNLGGRGGGGGGSRGGANRGGGNRGGHGGHRGGYPGRRYVGGGYTWNGLYWVDASGVCYTKSDDGEYTLVDCDTPTVIAFN